MQVDIYLREVNGKREIRIPWLPDSISFGSGEASLASYEILNLGEVAIPTGVGLGAYSWESVFPGSGRTDSGLLRGSWRKPAYYDDILNDWKEKGTKLNLLVTGYPINKSVYIVDYKAEASGGFGDITYSISLKEARTIRVTSSKVTVKKPTKTTTRSSTEDDATTYTVKSGDTLWEIAEKKLGSGAKWKLVYSTNKDIIEKTARTRWEAAGVMNRGSNNGHWIFPGTKLLLRN